MDFERRLDMETLACEDNRWLLEQLETSAADPYASLTAMTTALDIDLGLRLVGMPDSEILGDPEMLRSVRLTRYSFEAIKSFEEVLKLLCRHSIMNPAEIGEWLDDNSMQELHFKRPIELLFHNFTSEYGLDKTAVWIFASSARDHMRLDDDEYDSLWRHWLD
jgi:hypothetical protein